KKNTLDVFDNSNTDPLLSRLAASQKSSGGSNPDFLVFGVVTEYCVHLAADGLLRRGYGVSIIRDAIQSLDEKKGREILGEIESRGARLIAAEQALRLIGHDARDRFQLRKTAGSSPPREEGFARKSQGRESQAFRPNACGRVRKHGRRVSCKTSV